MHDTDAFARMPALDSGAEQPPQNEILSTFEKVLEVAYKQETYLVRDNGAVFRCVRPNARRRKLDEVWTFGTFNRHSGYFEIVGHVVHRIVATAFHGPGPSPDHVVDHVDTNRLNNRPENLRWVTRLENILLNPITRNRIIISYGSLEAFFENPGASFVPKWEWMKVVTKEEAQESRKRLLAWAEAGQAGSGGVLGDWVYRPAPHQSAPAPDDFDASPLSAILREAFEVPTSTSGVEGAAPRRQGYIMAMAPQPETLDTRSLTAQAVQRKWKTPTEFPNCPEAMSTNVLQEYLARLTPAAVFGRNQYGDNTVIEAAIGPDGALSVVCNTPSSIKGWSHARVFMEGELFCHESGGMFFTLEGAMKAHCLAIGAPTDRYEDSIDDYC
ncbi:MULTISPECIES: HNH endonuclease signature motif containing protein [unclassified Mesorhizobium]|uniref:HNH endonuclease signature motif containing protein n=1 Tax=unclassified Mesorhizobium TaxID=325217 RepID=UPI001AED3685|nr:MULTISPECIES: HNH endonuclease signature motif containing protein [unclassified Mesorhizobium]